MLCLLFLEVQWSRVLIGRPLDKRGILGLPTGIIQVERSCGIDP